MKLDHSDITHFSNIQISKDIESVKIWNLGNLNPAPVFLSNILVLGDTWIKLRLNILINALLHNRFSSYLLFCFAYLL